MVPLMMPFLAGAKSAKSTSATSVAAVKPLFPSSILKPTPSLKLSTTFSLPIPKGNVLQSSPSLSFTNLTSGNNSVADFNRLSRSLSTRIPPTSPPPSSPETPLEKESSETTTTETSKISPLLRSASSTEAQHGMAPDFSTAPHLAALNGGSGRIPATEYLSDEQKFPSGSLGYLVRKAILRVTPVVGDFASGKICDHYKSIEKSLQEPGSADNIRKLAEGETAYWRSKETGLAWAIGGATPACLREEFLLCTLEQLKEAGKWNDKYEGPVK
jgi:hypothetical protein